MTTTDIFPQNSAHTGVWGELCSASEHVSHLSARNISSSLLSADGRKRSNRGSSDDEECLTWDRLVNEDWRAGGPHLCTIPLRWQEIPHEHPLYSRLVPGLDLALEISGILRRSEVATEMIFFCTRQSILEPEAEPILTAVVAAKKRDISEDWLSVSREILRFLHFEGLVGISVEINDARASEPDECHPIIEKDAIFSVWDQVLDTILHSCDIRDWNSVGCYRIGKHNDWSANPATVLVTVDTSSRDWRPSREAIISILNEFNLPMVAVKIKRANIVCATSLTSSFPDTAAQATAQVGQSVGRRNYEGGCGTFGGWVELFDNKTAQWCTYGLTCSHVALPDDVPEIQTFRHNGVSFTDSNSAPYLQMDSPSERDLKSQLRAYDNRVNDLTEDVEYDEVKRKLENRESPILPYERWPYNHAKATIPSLKQKKLELEIFKADHKHHLGHVICASGTDRDVPSRAWTDGSPTAMDWALIAVPEGYKTNEAPFYMPGDWSIHSEGPSLKVVQHGPLTKCGRATGYTEGRYSGIKHARIVNQIANGQETRRITYEHTVTEYRNQPFSMPGDTGAFVSTMSLRVMGMVVAGIELGSITFITRIDDIFADIKARTGAGMVKFMGT